MQQHDNGAVLHVLGSWMPLVLTAKIDDASPVVKWLQLIALVISILVGLFSIYDIWLKVRWKKAQRRPDKQNKHGRGTEKADEQ